MNPFDLDATGLMIWGLVAHLIADWPLQNDWMANNKMKYGNDHWWDRHPAAYVHSGIHLIFLAFVFGWVAIPLAFVHLVIDCRLPVEKWSKFIKQTQPKNNYVEPAGPIESAMYRQPIPVYDVGTEVRFWTDQVFHITTIAIAALIVGSV